jgi:acyl-CoA synthetase (AMP-forming)/AMP-acid ligase II
MLDHSSHVEALSVPDSERIRSVGHVLPAIDLRVVGEDNKEVATGSQGEIAVRGPNVFGGYLNSEDLTTAVIGDGWFLTGDIGKVDEDGYIYVLDRKKDVINVGGESVCSVEVEVVLNRHPDVIEAAAIGIPSARFGEQIFAVVVCRAGITLTRREIRDFCRNQIGSFKIPSGVACVDALPKSALGKVLKAELRQQYGQAAR